MFRIICFKAEPCKKSKSPRIPPRTEVPGEGERRVRARQRGRGGGQDQAFPVACSATAEEIKTQRERRR